MNAKKALFTIIGGAALTAGVGILLTTYKDTSRRITITKKIRRKVDDLGKAIEESASDANNHFDTMGEAVSRMVNEGGKAI